MHFVGDTLKDAGQLVRPKVITRLVLFDEPTVRLTRPCNQPAPCQGAVVLDEQRAAGLNNAPHIHHKRPMQRRGQKVEKANGHDPIKRSCGEGQFTAVALHKHKLVAQLPAFGQLPRLQHHVARDVEPRHLQPLLGHIRPNAPRARRHIQQRIARRQIQQFVDGLLLFGVKMLAALMVKAGRIVLHSLFGIQIAVMRFNLAQFALFHIWFLVCHRFSLKLPTVIQSQSFVVSRRHPLCNAPL